MEITKVVKPFIRRGCQYFWQYSVYIKTLYLSYLQGIISPFDLV